MTADFYVRDVTDLQKAVNLSKYENRAHWSSLQVFSIINGQSGLLFSLQFGRSYFASFGNDAKNG